MKAHRKRTLASALLALALGACATPPTVYGPAGSPDAVGWRAMRIESDRYRISFRANPDLRAPEVEDLALRRAAEIAVADGYQWFWVVTRSTDLVDGRPGGGASVGVGGSSGSYGSSVGLGIGLDLSPDTRRYESRIEVLMGREARPDDPRAYDAHAVLSRPR